MSHIMNSLKLATAELTTARQKLADAQFQAQHGMANGLDFAAMVESTAYQTWVRASSALLSSH